MSIHKSSLLAGAIVATTVAGATEIQSPDRVEASALTVKDAIVLAQRAEPARQPARQPSTATESPLRDAVTVPANVRLVGDSNMMVSPAAAQLIENLAKDASFPLPDGFELWLEFCLLCADRPGLDRDELIKHGRTVAVK